LDRGDEPSISSDGRYVAYQQRGGAGCGKAIVRDLRTDAKLPLPGVETGACITDPQLSGDGHHLAFSSQGTAAGDPSALYLYRFNIGSGSLVRLGALASDRSGRVQIF